MTLKKIRERLDGWSAGSAGGLLVVSPEEKRRREEKEVAAHRKWRKRQAAESGRAGLAGPLVGAVGRRRRRGLRSPNPAVSSTGGMMKTSPKIGQVPSR